MKKELTEGNRGAINALKGYRVQALYSICRILESTNPELTYIPEGIEDLDIHDKGQTLLELVQVKNTIGSLTLSNLISKTESSFFSRAASVYQRGEKPKLQVVCFGKISHTLIDLFSDKVDIAKFKNTLREYGLSEEQLTYLKEYTVFKSVKEEDYQERAIQLIKTKAVAVDSTIAIDYLHYWIFYLSEKGGKISQESLIAKLNDIGKFINERQKFHQHLHSTIRSIEKEEINNSQKEELSKGFYEGVGAKYSHIQANLDIIRDEKINRLSEHFKTSDVVIIHGASGQGKSTLAYRYIWQYHSALAYEISPLPSLQSTLEQIQALKAISKSLEIPILLYIDVEPGNQNWTQVLKDFAYSKIFKFLVTIREEDWNKTPEKGIDFSFKDIELKLSKDEAKSIYQRLNEKITDKKFTGFEEAWLRFGGQGPLLEFTYLITQGETLKARIESQLDRIEKDTPEFIPLLKMVGLADSFGAKVKVDELIKANIVSKLRLSVKTLEREYLLRFSEGESWLVGLHPIRSKVISESLHLTKSDFENTGEKCINLIEESDLYIFLTNIFRSFPESRKLILKKLAKAKWNSFTAYSAVCNALIWIGIKSFIENNQSLLDEIYSEDMYMLNLRTYLDFTGTLNVKPLFADNENFQSRKKRGEQKLKSHGISKDQIFHPAKEWLLTAEVNADSITTDDELFSLGEFLFWVGYLTPEKEIYLNSKEIEAVICKFSIRSAARALFGLHHYSEVAKSIAFQCEPKFLDKLQDTYGIGLLEKTNEAIIAHFILDLTDSTEEGNIPHKRKLKIIEALRYGLPYFKVHGTKGYGHKIAFLSQDWDDSSAEIPIENNPIDYLVKINAILFNLFVYDKRPIDWEEFIALSLKIRYNYIRHLKRFLEVLEEYFNKKRDREKIGQFAVDVSTNKRQSIEYNVLFPKTISDKTGLVAEGSSSKYDQINNNSESTSQSHTQSKDKKKTQNNSETTSLLHVKFNDFREAHNNLFTSLNSFNWQSVKAILDKLNLSQEKHPQLLGGALLNIEKAYKKLDAYQTIFRTHFAKYIDPQELRSLEVQEKRIIPSLIYGWKHFINSSESSPKKVQKNALKTFQKLKADFEKRIKKDCLRATEESDHLIQLTAHMAIEPETAIIVMDIIDPLDTYIGLELALKAINNSVGSSDSLSLKHLMLEMNFNEFWVVPSILRKVIHCRAYKFQLFHFTQGSLNELPPYTFIPKNIAQNIIERLDLIIYPDPKQKVAFANVMKSAYQELTFNIGIISQLIELAEKDGHTEKGERIIEDRIEKIVDKVIDSFTKLMQNMAIQLKDYDMYEDVSVLRDEERDYLSILVEVNKAILPISDGYEEKTGASLNYDEIRDWKDRLEKVSEKLEWLYLYLIKRNVSSG